MKTLTDLVRDAEGIVNVPREAISGFERKQYLIISEIEARIAPDKMALTGLLNPTGIMYENPCHYAQLMINVFRFSCADLLVRVVAWGYRSCMHRVHPEYFPSAFILWRDAVRAHVDSGAALPIIKAFDWLVDNHAQFVHIAELPIPLLVPTLVGWEEEPQKALLRLLLMGDSSESLKLVNSLVFSPSDYKQFCIQVAQPVMYEIGRLWECGAITTAQEHLATAVLSRVLANLYGRYVVSDKRKGKAIVCAVLNEFHELGARMAADFLEIDGWSVYYLGSSVPNEEIGNMIHKIKPDFVALSVVMPFTLDNARKVVELVRSSRIRTKIFIGGPFADCLPEAFAGIGADAYGKSADDLTNWARDVWKGKGKGRDGR